MKILVINKYGQNKVLDSDIIPRVGDVVDMFYHPLPKVNSVLLWPSDETLKNLNCEGLDISVIVTVD